MTCGSRSESQISDLANEKRRHCRVPFDDSEGGLPAGPESEKSVECSVDWCRYSVCREYHGKAIDLFEGYLDGSKKSKAR